MPHCEELWAQNAPVSGAVDPVCPTVSNGGPIMPQCEELWAQNAPVSGAVDPVCPTVSNGGPIMPQCEELWAQNIPWRGDSAQLPEPVCAAGCQRVGNGQHNIATADCVDKS